jgi:hypothetical protein
MGSRSTDLTEGSCVVYECPRCLHHMWLLDDTLDTLRVYLSDPTLGYPELDLLCAKCQHVGSCRQTLARIIRETSSGGVLAEGFGGDQALAAGSDGGICITGEIERLW